MAENKSRIEESQYAQLQLELQRAKAAAEAKTQEAAELSRELAKVKESIAAEVDARFKVYVEAYVAAYNAQSLDALEKRIASERQNMYVIAKREAYEELRGKVAEKVKNLQVHINTVCQEKDLRISTLEQELLHFQTQLEAEKQAHQKTAAEAKTKEGEHDHISRQQYLRGQCLFNQLADSRASLETANTNIATLMAEKAELVQQKEGVESHSLAMQTSLELANAQIAKLEAEKAELEAAKGQVDRLREKKVEFAQQNTYVENQLLAAHTAYNQLVGQHDLITKDLRKQISDLTAALTKAQTALTKAQTALQKEAEPAECAAALLSFARCDALGENGHGPEKS